MNKIAVETRELERRLYKYTLYSQNKFTPEIQNSQMIYIHTYTARIEVRRRIERHEKWWLEEERTMSLKRILGFSKTRVLRQLRMHLD
jgi:hypothetical protein